MAGHMGMDRSTVAKAKRSEGDFNTHTALRKVACALALIHTCLPLGMAPSFG